MRTDRAARRAARLALGLLALGALSGCPPEKDPNRPETDRSGKCGSCLDACEANPDTRSGCIAACRNGACAGQ